MVMILQRADLYTVDVFRTYQRQHLTELIIESTQDLALCNGHLSALHIDHYHTGP